VGEDREQGWWFSDGYGDYIRHFLVAMGAVPEWAPRRENHLVRSSSIVTAVEYGPHRLAWSTFDRDATETLRLVSRPTGVAAGGSPLTAREDLAGEGFVVRPLASGGVVLRVRHRSPGAVVVSMAPAAGSR
jgi:hypothetical protein